MEKIERIKSELKAILSKEDGFQQVLKTIEQLLPKGSVKYSRYLSIKSDVLQAPTKKSSAKDYQPLRKQLLRFIESLETSDLGEQGQKTFEQGGPSINKPPSIIKKEGNWKTLLATLTATFVVVCAGMALIYFFSLKVKCDAHWDKAVQIDSCNSYQYFLNNCSNCPQVTDAQLRIKELCQD